MAVKIFFTNMGQLIGNVDSEPLCESWTIEKPVILNPTSNGLQMFDLLSFSEDDKIVLTQDQLVIGTGPINPNRELENAYSQQFGSGIQIASVS